MMDKILNLDSVDQYNSLYGLETLNPLVSVIDLNKATRQMDYVHWNYGVYALYLKLEKACDIKYDHPHILYRFIPEKFAVKQRNGGLVKTRLFNYIIKLFAYQPKAAVNGLSL